jgi:hypothetical protein
MGMMSDESMRQEIADLRLTRSEADTLVSALDYIQRYASTRFGEISMSHIRLVIDRIENHITFKPLPARKGAK